MHVAATSTLQARCSTIENDQFWMNLGDYISTIPRDESQSCLAQHRSLPSDFTFFLSTSGPHLVVNSE